MLLTKANLGSVQAHEPPAPKSSDRGRRSREFWEPSARSRLSELSLWRHFSSAASIASPGQRRTWTSCAGRCESARLRSIAMDYGGTFTKSPFDLTVDRPLPCPPRPKRWPRCAARKRSAARSDRPPFLDRLAPSPAASKLRKEEPGLDNPQQPEPERRRHCPRAISRNGTCHSSRCRRSLERANRIGRLLSP
jgi:hypothetical protein